MSSTSFPRRTRDAGSTGRSATDPDAALSARQVAHWLTDNAASLGARRINASLGRRIAPQGDDEPVVWISLSSEWASGRLVRGADGSSEIAAHRFSDGAPILLQRHPSTTAGQLDELADACARPLHAPPPPDHELHAGSGRR